MFAGLLTHIQLVLQQGICRCLTAFDQGGGPAHICTSFVIASHERVQQ